LFLFARRAVVEARSVIDYRSLAGAETDGVEQLGRSAQLGEGSRPADAVARVLSF
jgi:hypothetical protein